MSTQFFENSELFSISPPWVNFFLALGESWPAADNTTRRIAAVSMPCDSAAFGLVTLGALIADLRDPTATDKATHYANLIKYARAAQMASRLGSGSPEAAANANPGKLREVGSTGRQLKAVIEKRGSDEILFSERPGRGMNGPIRGLITEANSLRFYPADGFAPSAGSTGTAIDAEAYACVANPDDFVDANLGQSFSGLCLVSRGMGSTATRSAVESTGFSCHGCERKLSDLMAVADWRPRDAVSRCQLYNTRLQRLNKPDIPPRLAVADGDSALIAALDNQTFAQSDIIAIFDRCHERERLDQLAYKISSLKQWYERDWELEGSLPTPPTGVELLILRRKSI